MRASREHLRAERNLIRAKHIRASAIVDLSVHCAGCILLTVLLFPLADHRILLFWLVGNGLVVLFRGGVLASFRKKTASARNQAGAYLVLFLIGVLLSGLSFGAAGFFLYPRDNVLQQMLLTLTLWATATLSVDSSVPSPWTAVAYPLLMVAPVTLVSLLGANDHQHLIGLLGVVYLAVQFFYSLRLSRYFSENLSLQLDNLELTSELIHEVSNRIAVENIIKAAGVGRDA